MANGHELAATWGVAHEPLYRMTLKDEAGNPLVPRSGSVHSDEFKVTTQPDPPVGWKPYMVAPTGYRGRLDIASAHTEQGEMTVRIVDARTHTDNARRWVTAFLADDNGFNLLKHAIAHVEESLDGGDTWSDYFTGRVYTEEAPDVYATGPYFDLIIHDHRVEEYRKVFVGAPHRSVTYARPAPLFPIGPPQMREDPYQIGFYGFKGWDGQAAVPPAKARAMQHSSGDWLLWVEPDSIQYDLLKKQPERLFLTEDAAAAADVTTENSALAKAVGKRICTTLRVYIRGLGATEWKQVLVRPSSSHGFEKHSTGYDGATGVSPLWIRQNGRLVLIGAHPLPSTHPDYFALTHNTLYEIQLVDVGRPRPGSPLLIDDVAAHTLWADLAAGKFSLLDEDGEVTQNAIPVDATALAGVSQGVRFMITEPHDMQEFIERHLLKVARRAARVGRDGVVSSISVSLEAATASMFGGVPGSVPTLDQDLIEASHWRFGATVYSGVKVKGKRYGWHDEVYAQLKLDRDKDGLKQAPGAGLIVQDVEEIYLGARAAQVGLEPVEVEALGLRQPNFAAGFDPIVAWNVLGRTPMFESSSNMNLFELVARHLLNWYEDGSAFMHLTCRRAGTAEDLQQGDWVVVDADAIPNSTNNQRGGLRLGIVVERNDMGPRVELVVQDAGPNSAPTAPSLGATSTVTNDEGIFPTVPVTLNASSQPVELEFALTDPAETVRPADDSDSWQFFARITASATVQFTQKFDGYRVWFRARTARTPEAALPSGWVYPSNDYATIGGTPRVAGTRILLDGGNPSVVTYPNAYAAGYRIYYATHDPDVTPTLTTYVDVAATTDAIDLSASVVVAEGDEITIELEPWTGFAAGAVSGAAGPRSYANEAYSLVVTDDATAAALAALDQDITDLEVELQQSIADATLSAGEAASIEQRMGSLIDAKSAVDQRYTTIYGNPVLAGTPKTNLASAKSSFDSAHTSLVNAITSAIADGEIDGTEETTIAGAVNTYRSALATLTQRLEEATEAIQAATSRRTAMLETFQAIPPGMDSTDGVSIVSVGGTAGGSVMRVTGVYRQWYPDMHRAVPFNPNTLYRLEVRVRTETDDTTAPNELFWAGFRCLDAAGTVLSPGNIYAVAYNQTITDIEGWKTYVGWVKGTGLSVEPAPDPFNPSGTNNISALAYISPILLLNYFTPSGQVVDVDYFRIDAIATEYADAGDQTILDELLAVETAVTTLETYVDGAFWDNVVSAGEAKGIAELKRVLEDRYDELLQEYGDLLAHPLLSGTAETDLTAARDLLVTEYGTLLSTIDAAVDGDFVSTSERTAVDTSFDNWRTHVNNFRQKVIAAEDAIRVAGLDTAIDEVYDALDDLDTTLNTAILDGIDTGEAIAIGKLLRLLEAQYQELSQEFNEVYFHVDVNGYAVGSNLNVEFVDLSNKYTDLHNAISAIIAAGTVDGTSLATYNAARTAFNGQLPPVREAFEEAKERIKEIGVLRGYSPSHRTAIAWSGDTAVVTVIVEDQKLRAIPYATFTVAAQWRTVVQGTSGSYSKTWDTNAVGTPGTSAQLIYQESITVEKGTDVSFEYEIRYQDYSGAEKFINGVVPLTNLQARYVTREFSHTDWVREGSGTMTLEYGSAGVNGASVGAWHAMKSLLPITGSTLDEVRVNTFVFSSSDSVTMNTYKVEADGTRTALHTAVTAGGATGHVELAAFPNYAVQPGESFYVQVDVTTVFTKVDVLVRGAKAVFLTPTYEQV